MKKLFAFALVVTFLSCSESKEVETVTVENKFTIELPDYLTEATNLHPDASLQYQNALKEFYVVVIDEPKEEFLNIAKTTTDFPADFNGFHDILKNGLKDEIGKSKASETTEIQVNGLKAKAFSLTGEVDKLPIYYEIGYIEGKDRFYQIVSWTLEANKDKFKEPMQKIIKSFKEVGTDRSKKQGTKKIH